MNYFENSIFGQQEIIGLLRRIGYNVTKTTILRYMQNGYLLQPKRREFVLDDSRIYYDPLVILEIMTATLLFKGNFLNPNSVKRISRFVDEDVFVARLLFYKDLYEKQDVYNIDLFSRNFAEFTTCIKDRKGSDEMGLVDLPMSHKHIDGYLHILIPRIAEGFKFEDTMNGFMFDEKGFSRCYLGYLLYIYRSTFINLLNEHGEYIRSMS